MAVFRRPALPVPLDHAPTATAVAAMAVLRRPAVPAQAMLPLIRVTATARAVPDRSLRTITLSSHPALSIGLFFLQAPVTVSLEIGRSAGITQNVPQECAGFETRSGL